VIRVHRGHFEMVPELAEQLAEVRDQPGVGFVRVEQIAAVAGLLKYQMSGIDELGPCHRALPLR